MITASPYGLGHITKPGYGEPEPLAPACTHDTQENIDICLTRCPLPADCHMDSSACPLHESPSAVKKRLERDKQIRNMILDGQMSDRKICEKLRIGKSTFYAVKRRMQELGEINYLYNFGGLTCAILPHLPLLWGAP